MIHPDSILPLPGSAFVYGGDGGSATTRDLIGSLSRLQCQIPRIELTASSQLIARFHRHFCACSLSSQMAWKTSGTAGGQLAYFARRTYFAMYVLCASVTPSVNGARATVMPRAGGEAFCPFVQSNAPIVRRSFHDICLSAVSIILITPHLRLMSMVYLHCVQPRNDSCECRVLG